MYNNQMALSLLSVTVQAIERKHLNNGSNYERSPLLKDIKYFSFIDLVHNILIFFVRENFPLCFLQENSRVCVF